jgi:predicted nucleotidyltransferase component of viral defense system
MSEVKDFLYRLNHELRPRRPDIIEKDHHLHRLLHAISKDHYLARNMVFKGGTCLVKVHTDYKYLSA